MAGSLPGIEFDIQKQEAAYRKRVGSREDNPNAAQRPIIDDLFDNVRQIHFKAYNAYFNFNICRFSWLQVAVFVSLFSIDSNDSIWSNYTEVLSSQTMQGHLARSLSLYK